MLGLVLAQAALAPRPGPLSPGGRLPLAPCHAPCRCARVRCDFSPAYDTTIRYAAADWGQNLRSLPGSLILRRIKSPLLFNVGITSIICLLHSLFGPWPAGMALPHTLLSSALGLLLVFRTNAAYGRFWEARAQWGVVTTECRALASLACTYMTPRQARPLLDLIAAFPVVMKVYLRGGSQASQQRDARRLENLLAKEEVAALNAVVNRPQFILSRLRQLAQASRVAGTTDKEREVMHKSVGVLGDCVSICERIYNTPIPLAYSRHTSRFLVIYVTTLPLVLVGALRWATLPVMLTVCWALFGILEIGNLVEEPFTAVDSSTMVRRYVQQESMMHLLPLTEVCRTIRRDVRATAQYSQLGGNYSVPTIRKFPGEVKKFPAEDNFKRLRKDLKTSKANATKNETAHQAGAAANATKANATKIATNLNWGTGPPAAASQPAGLRAQPWWQGSDRGSEHGSDRSSAESE